VSSAFLQDGWKARPNLTINAGLRYERQVLRGFHDKAFIDFFHVSPRVGLSWDPLNDGKTKVFASYGEFVEAIPLDMNIRSANGERDATIINFGPVSLQPDPTYCTQDNGCDIKGIVFDDVDPDLRPQYQQEVLVGVERQLGEWTLGLHGIYRSLVH